MARSAAVPLLFCCILGPGPARAAKEAAKPAEAYVDFQTIGLPAVVHGRLVNYIFVQLRLHVAPGVDASKIQQGEPVIRDALVHAAARAPLNPPEDGVRLDDGRLRSEVMGFARARFGPGKVVSVGIQSETPQRRTGVPGAATLSTNPSAPG